MDFLEALILGVIQGLTEFLPVSSSGHLELAEALFGINQQGSLAFTVAVHGATVMSTIVVFRKELWQLIKGVFRREMNYETKFVINIFISMIPIMVLGLFFRDVIEGLYSGNILLIGIMLLVTAALLTFSQYAPKKNKPVTARSSFMMGVAQAFAGAFPGLSRSGSTISTGLMMGVNPTEVTKFSFLMVLIPILGVNFLDIVGGEFTSSGVVAPINVIAGALAAFITGTIACKFMIGIVRRGKLIWFAAYCVVIGIAAIIFSFI